MAKRTRWTGIAYLFFDQANIAAVKDVTRNIFQDANDDDRAAWLEANPNATPEELDAAVPPITQTQLDAEAAHWDNVPRFLHPDGVTVFMGSEWPALPRMRQVWRQAIQRGDADGDGQPDNRRGRFMIVDNATRILENANDTNFRPQTGFVVGQPYTFAQAAALLELTRILSPEEQ